MKFADLHHQWGGGEHLLAGLLHHDDGPGLQLLVAHCVLGQDLVQLLAGTQNLLTYGD